MRNPEYFLQFQSSYDCVKFRGFFLDYSVYEFGYRDNQVRYVGYPVILLLNEKESLQATGLLSLSILELCQQTTDQGLKQLQIGKIISILKAISQQHDTKPDS